MEAPQPVVNAVVSNGKVQQAKPGANIKERLFARAKGRAKGERILTDTLKEWVVEEGGSASSVNTFTTYMVDEGVLKRIAKGQFSIA
jgi:hypothetical protein